MKKDTEVVRLPKEYVQEIKKVQSELRCSFQSAFRLWNQKKGQTGADLFFMIVFFLFLAIGILVLIYINNTVITNMENTPTINQSAAAMEVFSKMDNTQNKLDYLMLAALIGFTLGFVILGYFIRTHPIFMPIYIIVIIIGMIITPIFQYVWDKISDSGTFLATKTAYLPITDHIFTYLPLYFAIIAIVGLVVTYAKPSGEFAR